MSHNMEALYTGPILLLTMTVRHTASCRAVNVLELASNEVESRVWGARHSRGDRRGQGTRRRQ